MKKKSNFFDRSLSFDSANADKRALESALWGLGKTLMKVKYSFHMRINGNYLIKSALLKISTFFAVFCIVKVQKLKHYITKYPPTPIFCKKNVPFPLYIILYSASILKGFNNNLFSLPLVQ